MKEKIFKLYYEEKRSQVYIGSILGISEWEVRKAMKEYGFISRPTGKIPNTNSHFLDTIDTQEKAYILGLITADGNVNRALEAIRLELKSRDEYLLEQIISLVAPGNKIGRSRGCSYITFSSRHMAKEVAKYGVVPNKSLTMDSISDLIPLNLYSHYIRGLFDGDGTATTVSNKYLKLGYNSGSKKFVESFRDFIVEATGARKNSIYFGTVFFTAWAAQGDCKKIADYLYKDNPTLFLKRKKDLIYQYVNTEVIEEV